MLESFMALVRGRRVVPPSPLHFTVLLPPADSPDMTPALDEAPDLENIAGVGCTIEYVDAGGDESWRRITCRKLSRTAGSLYLQAYCHEREAPRTFKVERISEVACGATGELYDPADPYFARFLATEGDASVVGFNLGVQRAADLRAGLNVLAFLARADGKVVPEEREVMAEFCRSFAVRYGNEKFAVEGACTFANRLAPDAETFYVSLDRLTREKAPEGLARLVAQMSGRLINADGVQDDREFYFGSKVQEYLMG